VRVIIIRGIDRLLSVGGLLRSVRRFSAEYLRDTRRGMWEEREALADLRLSGRERILDVGCGTGEFTRVLREESGATVVGLDADRSLLDRAEAAGRVLGDATRLPFRDGAFDLVVCQALLVNLSDPGAAIREFARVSADAVAAIEPDNAAVTVESTVEAESRLARRAREAYIDGITTDVTLGDVSDLFGAAGLSDVETRRYDHRRTIEPPYSESAIEGAARKATGERLAEKRATLLSGGLSEAEYDDLRAAWRAMGRDAIEAMRAGAYERSETTPFYVTVGHV
jgi:SAM-dependent methyltransferase